MTICSTNYAVHGERHWLSNYLARTWVGVGSSLVCAWESISTNMWWERYVFRGIGSMLLTKGSTSFEVVMAILRATALPKSHHQQCGSGERMGREGPNSIEIQGIECGANLGTICNLSLAVKHYKFGS